MFAPAPLLRPIADVPFELRGVHIYVQAKINGQGPFPMNIDTGSYLGVTGLLANRLHLESERQIAQGGAGAQTTHTGWGKIGTVQIGGARLEDLEGMIGSDQSGAEAGIGAELFERFTVEFDNDRRRMRLYPKGQAPVPRGSSILPLRFIPEQKPLVEATLGGIKGRFMLDTGGGVSIILQKAFWTKHRLDARFHPPITTIVAYGIGGPIFGSVGRLPSLGFGNLVLQNPIATYSTMTAGSLANPARDGLIGQKVLLHFNSIFDYAKRRLILTPSRTFAKRDGYGRTGFAGQLDGLGYRIEAIFRGGTAERAGLRKGDVILSADGNLLSDETAVLKAFRKPEGTRLQLAVLRNDHQLFIPLTLRSAL